MYNTGMKGANNQGYIPLGCIWGILTLGKPPVRQLRVVKSAICRKQLTRALASWARRLHPRSRPGTWVPQTKLGTRKEDFFLLGLSKGSLTLEESEQTPMFHWGSEEQGHGLEAVRPQVLVEVVQVQVRWHGAG